VAIDVTSAPPQGRPPVSDDVTTAPRKGRRRYSQLSRGDKIALGFFVGIPTFFHIMFVWVPTISTVALSFTEWDGLKLGTWKLVGFENYWRVFTVFDNKFFPALFNNLILLVFLSGCSAIGILFAYLLDKNIRGTAIYQSVLYMPVVLSLAVVGFIWKGVMWSPSQGMFNVILGRTAQGDQIDWVGNAEKIFTIHVPFLDTPLGLSKNFAALLIAMAWRHIGYVMVLYLAGLKSVDPSLREAAAIDGCNEWQSFRRVVFPVMRPINVVVFVITVIEALRAFDIIFALKKPPGTQVLGILVRDNLVGEGGGHVGLGSAYGVILLLLCLVFIVWYLINDNRESQA
jgi:multiple sugar transport system permease protein